MTNIEIHIVEGWVLKPGDKVLLMLDGHIDYEESDADEIMDLVKKNFPEVTFMLVHGVKGLRLRKD